MVARDASRKTRDTIVRLLGAIGSKKEVEEYLRRFSGVDKAQFAVVKVGGAVLRDDLDGLASSLAFLDRVGLCPVVVHGAGPQIDEALALAGIATERVDALRVTSSEALAVIRKVMLRENLRLVDALDAHGARARSLGGGVFRARLVDRARYGLVGDVEAVDLDVLRACVRGGHLPVLTCLGETAEGQIVNINAGIDFGGVEVIAFINNATDENANLSFDRERGGRARLGFRTNQPRTFGVTARIRF